MVFITLETTRTHGGISREGRKWGLCSILHCTGSTLAEGLEITLNEQGRRPEGEKKRAGVADDCYTMALRPREPGRVHNQEYENGG